MGNGSAGAWRVGRLTCDGREEDCEQHQEHVGAAHLGGCVGDVERRQFLLSDVRSDG
jgi:hypothetical protein